MVLRMTRREQSFQRSPLHTKHLPILDIGILFLRLMVVFENLSIGAEPLQIGQAADVIAVPVGEEGLVHCGFFVGEDGLELFGPGWFALAGVDEDALVAAADEVCVGSWDD